jgi:hypothetical protein
LIVKLATCNAQAHAPKGTKLWISETAFSASAPQHASQGGVGHPFWAGLWLFVATLYMVVAICSSMWYDLAAVVRITGLVEALFQRGVGEGVE